MSPTRMRVLVSTLAAAALLAYGLGGHALHQMSTDDEMAGAVAGLCLLLVTALGFAAVPRPAAPQELRLVVGLRPLGRRLPLLAIDRRARASPSTLQRFRN